MKLLAAYAHPADAITDCGGTLALHVARGDAVTIFSMTHGGRIHPNIYVEEWRKAHPTQTIVAMTRAEIIRTKRQELERAARIIGVERIIALDDDDDGVTVERAVVEKAARIIADEQPDVILMDYPMNAANPDPHTLASITLLTALRQTSMYLRNLDGRHATTVKQIFFTKLPVTTRDVLALPGPRPDLYVDISSVVGLKIAAMDQFVSQGYNGDFARKLVESWNGEQGRTAGVNFAEGFCRMYNETYDHLPVTEYAQRFDHLTSHRSYSTMNVRALFPERKENP
jgi:LmbE family N-acetylglucosaminyl deacetylase